MIFIDELKNLTLYHKQFFLPIVEENKRKGSAVLLLTPNYESSTKLMNHPLIINKYFESYFVEKDITYYINNENALIKKFDETYVHEGYIEEAKLDSSTVKKVFKGIGVAVIGVLTGPIIPLVLLAKHIKTKRFDLDSTSFKDKKPEAKLYVKQSTLEIFNQSLEPGQMDSFLKSGSFVPLTDKDDKEYIKAAKGFPEALKEIKPDAGIKYGINHIIDPYNKKEYMILWIDDDYSTFSLNVLAKGTVGDAKYCTYIIPFYCRDKNSALNVIEGKTKYHPDYIKQESYIEESSELQLFYLSQETLDGVTIQSGTKFARSINGFLTLTDKNLNGMELYIYIPDNIDNLEMKTDGEEVKVTTPALLKCIGKLRIVGNENNSWKWKYISFNETDKELKDGLQKVFPNLFNESTDLIYDEPEELKILPTDSEEEATRKAYKQAEYRREQYRLKYKDLPDSDFIFPESRSIPISNKEQIIDAIEGYNSLNRDGDKQIKINAIKNKIAELNLSEEELLEGPYRYNWSLCARKEFFDYCKSSALNEASITYSDIPVPKTAKIYHGSPIQGLKTINPNTSNSYPQLGSIVFASTKELFASAFCLQWRDNKLSLGTTNSSNNKLESISLWIKQDVDISKPCSLYELENDGNWRFIQTSKGLEIYNTNSCKVLKETKFNSFDDIINKYHIDIYDYNTRTPLGINKATKIIQPKSNVNISKYLSESYIEEYANIAKIDNKLRKYIENNIIPEYSTFDKGHNEDHVNSVIDFSLKLADRLHLDYDMCYTIAAYHDIGLAFGDRENHHINSAKRVLSDKNLSKWFTSEEIQTIANACKEHRASNKDDISNIYSKVVSDADRSDSSNINNMLKRSWEYNLAKYPDYSNEELFDIIYKYLKEKYGNGGYAKLLLDESNELLESQVNNSKRILSSREKTLDKFMELVDAGIIQLKNDDSLCESADLLNESSSTDMYYEGYAGDVHRVKQILNPKTLSILNKEYKANINKPIYIQVIKTANDKDLYNDYNQDDHYNLKVQSYEQFGHEDENLYECYLKGELMHVVIYALNPDINFKLCDAVSIYESGIVDYVKKSGIDTEGVENYQLALCIEYIVEQKGHDYLIKLIKKGKYDKITKYAVELTGKNVIKGIDTSVFSESAINKSMTDVASLTRHLKYNTKKPNYKLNKVNRDIKKATPTPDDPNVDSTGLTGNIEEVTDYKVSRIYEGCEINENHMRIQNNMIMYFNEAIDSILESKTNYKTALRTILYDERLKNNKDVFNIYDQVKTDNPYIKYTYLDYMKYKSLNLFVDLSYYNNVFFKNNIYKLDKGVDIYFEFINRLINDKRMATAGYTKKTVLIPVLDWDTDPKTRMWMYNEAINPISIIDRLLRTNPIKITNAWKDFVFVFIANNSYFKIDFSTFNVNEDLPQFQLFIQKMRNVNFVAQDPIDTPKESPKAITLNVIDKIETSQQITVNNLLGNSKKIDQKDLQKKIDTAVVSKADDKIKNDLKKDVDIVNKDNQKEKLNNDTKKDELVDKVKDAANKANDTEQAIDNLDSEEADHFKQMLLDLAAEEDDRVKINNSRASRMIDLQNNFMNKDVQGRKVKDIINTKPEEPLPVTALPIDSINPEWQELTYINFANQYDPQDDILKILNSLSDKTVPVVVRDIKVEDTSTSEDYKDTYVVNMEDVNGQRFTIKFDVPKFKEGKYMVLRGNKKTINNQAFLMPIIKTDEDTVQIVSNYNKIFVRRFGTTTGKSFPTTDRIIKTLSKIESNQIKVSNGDNSRICSKYELPIDYIDLSSVYNKIELKEETIYFNQDELRNKYIVDDSKGIPYGIDKGKNVLYYNGKVPAFPTFSSILLALLMGESSDFTEIYQTTNTATRYTYSKASILSSEIPLVVICAYSEGLQTILKKANIRYDLVEKKPKINKDLDDIIKFKDGYLQYELSYVSSLLMNGLKECNTEDYSLADLNNKSMYLDFLDIFGGRIKADGLDNFYDLMIDSMTLENLEYYKLPTDYITILLYSNSLLADNKYIKHTDMTSRRMRRNEIVAGYVYKSVSESYGAYRTQMKRSRQACKMTIKQDDVINKLMSDPTASDLSELNPLLEIESLNAVSFKGLSGMNSDRSYSLDKRTFDDSMLNVLAMSTGFAGNVGITRQATIDMNIDTKRGYVKTIKDPNKLSITKTFSMTEALTPFGTTGDDPFRSAMTFIQTSKHGMRTKVSHPLLITNGADEALPYLISNSFAFKAKSKGKIEEKNDKFMIIKYDDGTSDYVDLRENVRKNSNGGFFITIKLDSDLKVGSTVKANQIVAYDKLSFSDKVGATKNIAYNLGVLAKLAILNTDEGYEDSAIISEKLSDYMTSDVILKKDYSFPKNSNIYKMVKPGQEVQEGEPLIIFQNSYDDNDMNVLLKNLGDEEEEISNLGRIPITSKVTGVVQDIKIYRTVEIDELSPSLKKIVNDYEKPIRDTKKTMNKYNIQNTDMEADYKLEPTGKLKGAADGVYIEIYLKYEDRMSIGDKLIYYSALKGVVKDIFPRGKEPYSTYRPEENLDTLLAIGGISGRMTTSVKKVCALNKFIIELDRHVKDMAGIKYKLNL